MNHEIFWDSKISMKAKGIYATVMSMPGGWREFTATGVAKIVKESKDAIASGIDELEAAGYITKRRTKNEHGHFLGIRYEEVLDR